MEYTVTMFGYSTLRRKVRPGWLSCAVEADSEAEAIERFKEKAQEQRFSPDDDKPEVRAKVR